MFDNYCLEAAADGIMRISVGALVIRKNSILLLKRSSEELFLPNVYEFPSGKVEQAEDTSMALARELFEETGLIFLRAFFHNSFDYEVTAGKTRQFNFLVEATGDTVLLNPLEHSAYVWLDLDTAGSTKLEVSELVKLSIAAAARLSCKFA